MIEAILEGRRGRGRVIGPFGHPAIGLRDNDAMSHLPINHHLQPLYRTLAGAAGLYVLAFGVIGLLRTSGLDVFAQDGLPTVLGLRANRAFAILSVVVGIVLVVGAVIGRSIDMWINLISSVVFLTAGMAMMALLETDLNFLGFTVTTCIVSFVIGLVLGLAGLYGTVGTAEEDALEERFRHGQSADPEQHAYNFEGGPKPPHQTEDHRFA
jgi:hypothetical protein